MRVCICLPLKLQICILQLCMCVFTRPQRVLLSISRPFHLERKRNFRPTIENAKVQSIFTVAFDEANVSVSQQFKQRARNLSRTKLAFATDVYRCVFCARVASELKSASWPASAAPRAAVGDVTLTLTHNLGPAACRRKHHTTPQQNILRNVRFVECRRSARSEVDASLGPSPPGSPGT